MKRVLLQLLAVGLIATTFALGLADARPSARLPGVIAVSSFVQGGDGSVYLVSGTGSPRLVMPGTALSWSPDGSRFVVRRGDQRWVVRSDGRNVFELPQGAANIAWSQNGMRLAFTSPRQSGPMYVVRADGTGMRRLRGEIAPLPRGWRDNNIAWSPDNRTIIFSSGAGFSTLDVDSSAPAKPLVFDPALNPSAKPGPAYSPQWSSDGKRIAFVAGDLFLTDPDGRNTHAVPGGGEPNFVWSPDGSKLAFKGKGIWVVNADGTNVTQVSHNACYWCGLSWSPDSRWIAYFAHAEPGTLISAHSLYAVKADGTQRTLVYRKLSAYYTFPLWKGGTADNGV